MSQGTQTKRKRSRRHEHKRHSPHRSAARGVPHKCTHQRKADKQDGSAGRAGAGAQRSRHRKAGARERARERLTRRGAREPPQSEAERGEAHPRRDPRTASQGGARTQKTRHKENASEADGTDTRRRKTRTPLKTRHSTNRELTTAHRAHGAQNKRARGTSAHLYKGRERSERRNPKGSGFIGYKGIY